MTRTVVDRLAPQSPGDRVAALGVDSAELRRRVAHSVARSPIVGVVRTTSRDEARRQASLFAAGGLELIEITFTVPQAEQLIAELLAAREGRAGPPWIGAGTVTDRRRLELAISAGAELIVSPNSSPDLLQAAATADRYLIAGALTPTEIVAAWSAGADLVKVYPLPPVGGPAYLSTVRQPLSDIAMLAGGGFGIEEISAYRQAGAVAFGIGAPLLAGTDDETKARIRRALTFARGQEEL